MNGEPLDPAGPSPEPISSDGDIERVPRRIGDRSPIDVVLIASGLLFVIATFLPWYEATVGPLSITESAWNVGALGLLAALCGVAAAAVAVAVPFGVWKISFQSAALVEIVLAPATLFFTFLRVVVGAPGDGVTEFTRGLIRVSRGIGLWGGLVLAAVMTAAAVQKYRNEVLR